MNIRIASSRTSLLWVATLVAWLMACGGKQPAGGDGGDTGTNTTIDGASNGDGTGLDRATPDGDASDGIDTPVGDGPASDGPIQVGDAVIVPLPDGGTYRCFPTSCSNHLLECGDCIDNDADGLIDSLDPECLGPCDNTEGPALDPNVGGGAGGPCAADCFFDFGNGSGNDDCYWDHRCDPLSVAPNYYPEGMTCQYDPTRVGTARTCPATQSSTCLSFCTPLTPNGCDCFGCCTFPGLETAGPGGTPGYVWLGSVNPVGSNNYSCTLAAVTDPSLCHACTPAPGCLNECGHCEVCIGRPVPPADCFAPPPDASVPADGSDGAPLPDGSDVAAPPPPQCPGGEQPCGLPGQAACPNLYYCITGCCQLAPG